LLMKKAKGLSTMDEASTIKVGDVVLDSAYGMSGLVVELNPRWVDSESGEDHTWQFGVLYEDGQLGYADSYELTLIGDKK